MNTTKNQEAAGPIVVEKTSVVLENVLAETSEPTVRVGYVMMRLRSRSFGGLFILLAVLGMVPGVSAIAGLAMIIPAAQLALGLRSPVLPRFIRRRNVETQTLRNLFAKTIPLVVRLERYVKPRWLWFTTAPVPTLIGVLIIGLAAVVILPLPFSNMPPAVSLILLSLGLLERDGLMIFFGLLVAMVALSIGGMIFYLAFEGTSSLIERVFGTF